MLPFQMWAMIEKDAKRLKERNENYKIRVQFYAVSMFYASSRQSQTQCVVVTLCMSTYPGGGLAVSVGTL